MDGQLAELRRQLEEEKRRREEEQRRREEAEANAEQSQPKTLTEYLAACHDFSIAIEVVTDKTLTTQGDTTEPAGRLFPPRIVPWKDFPNQQEETWEQFSISPSFHSRRVFPSSHQLDYVRKYLDPISSEIGLRHYARETVENPVRTLFEEVYKDEELRNALQLRGTVMFESHTNLGQPSGTSIDGGMEHMSITEPDTSKRGRRRAKGKGGKADKGQGQGKQRTSKSAGRRRPGNADQFCIYEMADGGQRTPVVSIEYKAPHKFPLAEIVAGLDGEIRPAEEVINKEGDDFEFLSKSLVAAVITQLFSGMIGKGVQWGYICTGEANIFLHIPDDPGMVYYYLSIPGSDVQEDDDNRLHRTAVAQVSAFVLRALASGAPGQSWHDAAAGLDMWAVEYIDILKKIPETVRKERPHSSYRPGRWKGFLRSPIRTRSRRLAAACKEPGDDGDNSGDADGDGDGDDHTPPTPTPRPSGRRGVGQSQSTAARRGRANSGRNDGSSAGGQKWTEATSKPRIEDRPYCTQRCLLGLAYGGPLDKQCPNFQDHKGKHIDLKTFLCLIRHQLATDRVARSALKVRLSSHGYTVVAKGMEKPNLGHLRHERRIYNRVKSIQGKYVPVCLGFVNLERPYYYDGGAYVSMIFLSWAGRPIIHYLNPENKGHFLGKTKSALRALHRLQVLHKDAEPRNILWDEQGDALMLVDFERAEIQAKQPLGTITPNRKRKRDGEKQTTAKDDFDKEIQQARGCISRCAR
ncbi:hypothetical protein H2199_008768 [Coniosporium tulheliwenetii]|uniref:Uncharacterized protein n=1 Tax=Coniosporium tulheliwenetii TaxID=3383036 RepID=A0ACC2YI58_9PEZI|nr:hypothetical protein H2199_008768 [Cladosporium sp. JES 115]